jgi:hypothetical protein
VSHATGQQGGGEEKSSSHESTGFK